MRFRVTGTWGIQRLQDFLDPLVEQLPLVLAGAAIGVGVALDLDARRKRQAHGGGEGVRQGVSGSEQDGGDLGDADGLVAAGTGVLLNNELDDFAAAPGVPNAYGLTGGKANAPGPRKRPLSSMAPTMMFRDGKLELVTGSPGGSRIITIVLEMIVNMVDFGMNVAEATQAVRIHDQLLPDKLFVERGLNADTIRLLQAQGYAVDMLEAWGSTESIAIGEGLLAGAADPRQRGTLAIGY